MERDEHAQKYFEKLDKIYSLSNIGELEKINAKICAIQLCRLYNIDELSNLSIKNMNNFFKAFKNCNCCERHQTCVPDEIYSIHLSTKPTKQINQSKMCPCLCRMVKRTLNKVYICSNEIKMNKDIFI